MITFHTECKLTPYFKTFQVTSDLARARHWSGLLIPELFISVRFSKNDYEFLDFGYLDFWTLWTFKLVYDLLNYIFEKHVK